MTQHTADRSARAESPFTLPATATFTREKSSQRIVQNLSTFESVAFSKGKAQGQ